MILKYSLCWCDDHHRRRALAALRPPPRLNLSTWIEQNIVLPDDVSALPGKVRLWPHQREIADAITDPLVERITIVKPARAGFTTLLTAAIGYFVTDDPCPILALLPTESDARDNVVSDIEPTFAATPALQDEVKPFIRKCETLSYLRGVRPFLPT